MRNIARIVEIIIRADNRTAIRALRELGMASESTSKQVGASWRKTGTALQGVGRVMTTIGVAAGAFGYEAVKSAMNFQTAMTRIQTQAGASRKQVANLSAAVMGLAGSGQVQYGPTQLANALYHIMSVSAGTYPQLAKTSIAMGVLKTAAEGAAIGGSNLEDTTTALMGLMVASHAPIQQSAKYMALMNATVGVGNMRMQDLVTAMGRGLIPAFRNVHLTATDAFAAIALFSDQGTKAGSAAAQLSTALHYLVQPGTKADKYLAYIGLSAESLAADLMKPQGLLQALKDLKSHMATLGGGQQGQLAQEQVLYALLPGGRGRILQQALNNLNQYGGKIGAIYKDVGKLGLDYQTQQQTFSGKLHTAWAVIQTDLVKFGNALIPIIEKYMPLLMKHLEDFFRWLNSLSPAVKDLLTKLTIGFAIGGPIIYGIGKLVSLVGILKGAFAALIPVARTAAAAETAAADAGAGAGVGAGLGAAGAGGAGALGGPAGILTALGAYLTYSQLSKHHQKQTRSFLGRALGLKDFAGSIDQLMGGHPGKAAQDLLRSMTFGFVGHTGGYVTSGGIQHFASGGYVDNVPAMLQTGEGVLNRAAMSSIGINGLNMLNSGGGVGGMGNFQIESTPVYVMLDGRVLARAVLQQTLRKAARGPSSLVGGALSTGTVVPT